MDEYEKNLEKKKQTKIEAEKVFSQAAMNVFNKVDIKMDDLRKKNKPRRKTLPRKS